MELHMKYTWKVSETPFKGINVNPIYFLKDGPKPKHRSNWSIAYTLIIALLLGLQLFTVSLNSDKFYIHPCKKKIYRVLIPWSKMMIILYFR